MKRLRVLSEKAKISSENEAYGKPGTAGRNEFNERFAEIEELFAGDLQDGSIDKYRDDFLSVSDKARNEKGASYIDAVKGFPADVSEKGVLWLQRVVDVYCEKAQCIIPSLNMFGK